MPRHRAARLLFPLIVASVAGAPAAAQDPQTAPLVLRLPGGTRALGMGNAFVAGRGPEALFYNPAQIGVQRGAALSIQRFGSASTLGSFSTAGGLGKVALAAGVQYLNYHTPSGAFFFTPPGLLTQGAVLGSSSLAATVAGAIRWKGVRFGAAAKYVEERVFVERDGSGALDVGAAKDVGGLSVGLAVQNLGARLSYPSVDQHADLPSRVTLGAAFSGKDIGTYFDLGASAAISRERDGRIVPAGGVELTYEPVSGWTFTGRVGARRVDGGTSPSESPLTLGASFGLDRFALDYAFVPYRGVGAAHRIGIRIQ
jgi:hypothetical protein